MGLADDESVGSFLGALRKIGSQQSQDAIARSVKEGHKAITDEGFESKATMVSRWMLPAIIMFAMCMVPSTTAFVSTARSTHSTMRIFAEKTESEALPTIQTPEEAAASLTEYMARAHEEKIRAMASIEKKYKDQIEKLEARIAELEASPTGADGEPTSSNSYAFPATNKALTEQVRAYQTFIQDYFIKAQAEKLKAVQTAEAKMKAKYEAILAGDELQ